jgi:hypothetical protein
MTKPKVRTLSVPLIQRPNLAVNTVLMNEGWGQWKEVYVAPDYLLLGEVQVHLRITSTPVGILINGGLFSPGVIEDPNGMRNEVYGPGIPLGFETELPAIRFTRS